LRRPGYVAGRGSGGKLKGREDKNPPFLCKAKVRGEGKNQGNEKAVMGQKDDLTPVTVSLFILPWGIHSVHWRGRRSF